MIQHCVVVIDLQKDYLASGKWPLSGIDDAVDNASRVIDLARRHAIPVLHVRHEGPEDAPFFVAGSDGAEFIDRVAPGRDEQIIVKAHPNSFKDTNLQDRLAVIGATDLIIVGAMSHMCIDATARAASDLGFAVTVLHDAVATCDLEFDGLTVTSKQVHASHMAALEFGYAKVLSTDEICFA